MGGSGGPVGRPTRRREEAREDAGAGGGSVEAGLAEPGVDPAAHDDVRVLSSTAAVLHAHLALFLPRLFLPSSELLPVFHSMARVYADVNARLGPTWYDYGEHAVLGAPRASGVLVALR